MSNLMTNQLDGMIAVATGHSSAVERWTESLRKAKIPFTVAKCLYHDKSAPTDHAEIWVKRGDVEIARAVIRSRDEDKSLIW